MTTSTSLPDEDFAALVQEIEDSSKAVTLARCPSPATPDPTTNCAVAVGSSVPYSHQSMVELMLAHPEYSHAMFANHFGRAPSWMASVLASDSFQQALEPVRHLVVDPTLTASMEERFRALALRSVTVLQDRLNSSGVSDLVVLKAAEIGVKALGMGQRPVEVAPPPPAQATLSVAEKILAAMDELDRKRTIADNSSDVIDAEVIPGDKQSG